MPNENGLFLQDKLILMSRRDTMVTSKKLSPERLKKMKNFPITYDEDSPKLEAGQIDRIKPAYPEYIGKLNL
jgi:hypothetical protein